MNKTTYRDTIYGFADQLLKMVSEEKNEAPNIGIAITTHTRPNGMGVLSKTLTEILRHRPAGSRVVVVDDASEIDLGGTQLIQNFIADENNQYYRFKENVGIALAKNKCFELLQDCQHLFLFDDDTFPLVPNWYEPYVNSAEAHLMYIFEGFKDGGHPGDITRLYEDDKIVAYTHVRGCMLYFKRICLEKVGGMSEAFGKWGNEHKHLSNRIYAAGLNTFRYMDVQGSSGLFYSGDEHRDVTSTFIGTKRNDALETTQHIVEMHRNTPVYCEFRTKAPVVVSTYYTGIPDPQRGQKWAFSMDKINDLLNSVIGKTHKFVLLHDVADMPLPRTHLMDFRRVQATINPYFQRWVNYYQYLRDNRNAISWAFLVDATDVEMLNTPQPVPGKIYIGSENEVINCEWLRSKHTDFKLKLFYKEFGKRQLLNAGVVGGYVEDLLPFCKAMIDCMADLVTGMKIQKQDGPGQTDMAVLNMVAYTQFADKIITGSMVTTEFKANARNNFSWFKHK